MTRKTVVAAKPNKDRASRETAGACGGLYPPITREGVEALLQDGKLGWICFRTSPCVRAERQPVVSGRRGAFNAPPARRFERIL